MKTKFTKVLIIPYFGGLPAYLELWMKSCSYNVDYTFLFYTDVDTSQISHPKNIIFKHIQLHEIWGRLSAKLKVRVFDSAPYKLCDLRPAYGEIFGDDIKEYDFWGYCDTDLIFGTINDFITDDILERYQKIFNLGHFTLYRNIYEINTLYRNNPSRLLRIINSHEPMHFDEGPYPGLIPMYESKKIYASLVYDKVYNINHIFWDKGIDIYTDFDAIADIHAFHDNLQLSYASSYTYKDINRKHSVFQWKAGKLQRFFLVNGEIRNKEYMYIHLQKRQMKDNTKKSSDGFFITNHSFEDLKQIDVPLLKTSNKNNITAKKYFYIKRLEWQVTLRQKLSKLKLKTGFDIMKIINNKGITLYNE